MRNDRNHTYCLVCSNIKDFKLVNELFGIEKGDEIIKMQAGLSRLHLKVAIYVEESRMTDLLCVCRRTVLRMK